MDKQLTYQSKKIFYRCVGNRKPVILIHGFGEDHRVWNDIVRPPQNYVRSFRFAQEPPKEGLSTAQTPLKENALLTDKFMFITPDLPGSGQSEKIDDMSMEGMAEVIKKILEVEVAKVPPPGGFRGACPVIGHSMGGYITLALAEKYYNHVSAFGLFHSTAFADSEEKKAIRRKGIEFINEHGAFEFIKTTTPNLFSTASKDEMPESIGAFIEQQRNFNPAALVSYYRAMMARPDRAHVLQNTAVPVLFIMGKYDNAVPLADGLKQCHLPEKSYIHILQNSAHMGMMEEKERCNMILEKFLLETSTLY